MDGQKFYLRKRYMVKKSAAAAAAKTMSAVKPCTKKKSERVSIPTCCNVIAIAVSRTTLL